MSQSYLERYQQGDYARVWAELVDLGPQIRNEPLLFDAQAVAHVTMQRAAYNVALLIERLTQLGYQFAAPHYLNPSYIWWRPDTTLLQELRRIEQIAGPLPLALTAWYEIVGAVNLMGSHPHLSSYYELDAGFDRHAYHGDPLEVDAFDGPYLIEEDAFGTPDRYKLYIMRDATVKAGLGGDESIAMILPNAAMDAPLVGYGDDVLFLNYIRTCFQWGGFPGLSTYPGAAQRELAFLTHNLLPL